MRLLIVRFLSCVALLSGGLQALLASDPIQDKVLDDRIKSVFLYREGWNLSYPVIKFNSDDKLVLDFDLLSDNPETYYYTFIHCDRDWSESSVFPGDYIDGLMEDQIEDYKASFNTKTNYYHYKLIFPGDRMKLRLSGNYVIKVYPSGNPDKPVLTKRFIIAEESASVKANAHRPTLAEFYNTGQQVDFTVSFPGLRVNDPMRDISSVILQNGKWYDAKTDLQPDLSGSNELRYNSLSERNIFPAGNEYRYFDIKSLHYQTEFIRQIDFVDDRYHIFLVPSDNREFKPYFFNKDLNGKYYVAIKEGRNMDTDPDYVFVYFTLPATAKAEDGDVYVSGALTNWEFTTNNRMIWDESKKQYQCSMLLKQGWYNYEYIYVPKAKKPDGPSRFEGNHYETENDYQIVVYFRGPGDRYDRVIAATVVNSSSQAGNN